MWSEPTCPLVKIIVLKADMSIVGWLAAVNSLQAILASFLVDIQVALSVTDEGF